MSARVWATRPDVPDEAVLDLVAARLAAGALAVVPTETVYGIAARIDRPEAVARLARAKRREGGKPLQVLVADADAARSLAGEWHEVAATLAAALWPGGLTLVVPAGATAPPVVVAADGSVGLRCPDHPALQALLRRTGPLAASSANLAGRPPATTCAAALEALGDEVDVALDTGPAAGGVASTVVRAGRHGYECLRVGALSAVHLEQALAGRREEAVDER